MSVERVLVGDLPRDKPALLRRIARCFHADDDTIAEEAVYRVLEERERLASTGAGSGIAIPHGRLTVLVEMRAVLAIAPHGIEFDAVDGDPVTLIVAILGPLDQPTAHLRALARTSRSLRDPRVRDRLLATTTPEEALTLLRALPADG